MDEIDQLLDTCANEVRLPTRAELCALAGLPCGDVLQFDVPTPASLKNSRQLVYVKGQPLIIKSKKADVSVKQVRIAALAAMRSVGAWLPTQDVRAHMVHDVIAERLRVTIGPCGERAKGRTGRKRDVQNLPDVVLDALQGIAFTNDNQVTDLRVRRLLTRS